MSRYIRPRVGSLARWCQNHPLVLPALVLLLGGIFRFYNLNWDHGHQLHPDERWIYEVISGAGGNPPLGWPTSLSQFLDVGTPHGSPLDPHFFAYGSLPFYLLALVAGTMDVLGRHVFFLSSWTGASNYDNLPAVGRSLSAILDLITVVLTGLLARRVFGYWTGVLAMALTAFTVLDIQLAHFYAVDTVLVPFTLLTLIAAVDVVRHDRLGTYLWGGVALGAALATKTTALLLVIPFGLAGFIAAWQASPWEGSIGYPTLLTHYRLVSKRLNRDLQRVLTGLAVSAATFVVLEPYAILDRETLVKNIAEQQAILVNNDPPFGVPYTIQYAHTLPYLYQLKNLLWWDLGAPLALAAFVGTLFYLARWGSLRRHPERLVLLAWVLPYFLFVGRFLAKFSRYMLPITPVITILGAALLIWLVRRTSGIRRIVATSSLVIVVLGSLAYSLAYMNIYSQPNTRVAASRWIFTHVRPGSTIAVEGPWDDPLPMDELGHSGSVYHQINLDLYADDGPAKIRNITDVLSRAQYIVMSSERMIGSIPRLPERYPITTRYYDLLFAGQLNFRLQKVFQAHPQLGPFVVHDYGADESFHVYDHPIVRIFARTGPISSGRVAALLTPNTPTRSAQSPAPVRVASSNDTRLILTPSEWSADQKGPTMDQMFPPDGFAMKHPILVWLLALEILGLAAFPITFLLFRRLLDRGFVLAKTLAVLLVGYVVWILVSVGVATYTRGLIIAITALLVLIGTALYARNWRTILAEVRRRRRAILVSEAVFLAGFALFVLLRMWYPDLGHQFSPVSATNAGDGRMGEKQMELAFLNAIVRSQVFPPLDPFFSHGYINYYYYGFVLVGTLCKLTQIGPATGFNLAIPTFFGLLVGSAFSVGLTLTRRIAAGLWAAVFVGLLGNLNGGWQLIRDLMAVGEAHSSLPVIGGIVDVASGIQQVLFNGKSLPPFDFWESTRIVPPVGGPITEFPYFTFLFADLHPHLIAYPMTCAAVLFAVNLLFEREMNWERAAGLGLIGSLLLGAIAVTNPWDFPTYLIVVVLGAFAGSYAVARRLKLRVLGRPLAWLIGLSVGSALLYLPFKMSYQTVFVTGIGLVRGITPDMLSGDGVTATDMHNAVVTPLSTYLEHFGFFLFIILSYLAVLNVRGQSLHRAAGRVVEQLQFAWYYRDRLGRVWHAARVAERISPSPPQADATWWLAGLILAGGLYVFQFYLLSFLAILVLVVAYSLVRDRNTLPSSGLFVLCLLFVPLLLSMGTQIVYVKDWLAEGPNFRMNTIFKFYNQAWVLYALVAAVGLHVFVRRETRPESVRRSEERRAHLPQARAPIRVLATSAVGQPGRLSSMLFSAMTAPRGRRQFSEDQGASAVPRRRLGAVARLSRQAPLWTLAFAILGFTCLLYTYAGTVARETYRQTWLAERSVPLTLDGSAFMTVSYPEDYAAISWLNKHVPGAPVMAEAGDSYYNWRSRVSMFTGLPDIVNGIHEPEQRYSDELDASQGCPTAPDPARCSATTHSRSDDLKLLYTTTRPSTAEQIIRRYGVRYIYVGFSERQLYGSAGLQKFNRMVGHGLQKVFHLGGTTIYRVVSP